MAVDSFSHSSEDVLTDLDPLSRALLDLSLQRGMEDAEIADVLGTDEQAVLEVRVGLLRTLADKVAPEYAEADPEELQAVVADRLYGEQAAEAEEVAELEAAVPADDYAEPELEAEPEADADPEPAYEADPDPEPRDDRPTALHAVPATVDEEPETAPAPAAEAGRRRSPLVVLVPLLLLVALAGAIVLLTSGGEDGGDTAETPAAQAPAAPDAKTDPKNADAPQPRAVRMNSLGAGDARGTATLDGDRLTLKLRGLPDPQGGAYSIWLYDSVIDAKLLGTSKSAKIDLDAKLPANAKDYEFVDVSLEPADTNANHSGQSVLRVPLAKLQK